ncbi:methylated-DNA--[protein]-cysteine S-methyltransferase [Vibrio makurazakiensis]|uniref:methylated-DNA--[protein]-cysteine S-methyltransferase n=1 Tax=Vibrio makurazakiensis TaxID=2910250 RepID=UPI003D0B7E3E
MNRYCYFQSPLGQMTLQANEHGLLGAWFETHTTQPEVLGNEDSTFPVLMETSKQLEQYFAGETMQFALPLAAKGTAFQMEVWNALLSVPYGETWSYQKIAEFIGNPKAVRAVGAANGKNPISIIVPCHRVIGMNGKLTGYAGGVERKRSLLKLEGILE